MARRVNKLAMQKDAIVRAPEQLIFVVTQHAIPVKIRMSISGEDLTRDKPRTELPWGRDDRRH
jgi:hypothetical protein